MGKQRVRMKAVVYALSPFQQKVMKGLWNDLPNKIHHKVSDNWISTLLLLGPLVGTYSYFPGHRFANEQSLDVMEGAHEINECDLVEEKVDQNPKWLT